MAEWENDPVAVQDWQADPLASESWKSDPIDTGRTAKRQAMQKEMADLQTEGLADEITSKIIEGTEGVVSKIAYPAHALLDLPVQLARMMGVEAPPSASVPALSQETVLKGVQAVTEAVVPGGNPSEGTVGQAVQELAAGFISGATTPTMVAGMVAGGKAPVAIARAFQAEMLGHVPASVAAVVQAEPGQAKTTAALELGVNVALPALIEKGISKHTPKQIIENRAAEVGPATEAAVKGKEATKTPPAPTTPLETATSELVKPAEVAQPIPAEPSLPIPTPKPDAAPVERVTELRAPEVVPLAPQSAPAQTRQAPKFTMTFEQFMEAPREGALLDELRTVPKQQKLPEQELAESKLDTATKAIEAAKLEWIYDRSNPNKKANIEASISRLTKAKKKIVTEYNEALSAKIAADIKARPVRQKHLYDVLVEKGVIQDPKPVQPELVGMGAATPAEYIQTPQTATGIKNRTVDVERARRDLPPAMEAGRQSFGEAWERAMGRMDKDTEYQRRLIAELGDKPRAVTDIEDATLLHRQIDLQNEYGKATRAMAQAFDDGRMEDVAHEQVRVSELSDQLHELYTINQAVGTETGRGLAARKMMAYEDFSLAKMEVERRAAKGGDQLTPEERAEVVTLQQKIETTQKAYDAYVSKTQQQITALEVKAALQAATQKAQDKVNPKVLEIAKRIAANLHREADAARERLKSQGVTFGSGPLHELPNIRDYAIIGADHLVTGGVEFAKWSGKMVKEFGESIRPHLEALFDESQKVLNTIDKQSPLVQEAPKRTKPKVTKESAHLSYEATKAKVEWQKKLIQERLKQRPVHKKVFGAIGETLNTARVLMTTGELSAVLRQGGFGVLGSPFRAAKAFPAMFKALISEERMHKVNMEIASRPNYPLYVRSKLFLAEHGHSLSKMEEAYMNSWLEDPVPQFIKKHYPKTAAGIQKVNPVAATQRAFSTFLNKLRADSFDVLAERLVRRKEELTPERAETISNFINITTGRGTVGRAENFKLAESALVGMNKLFFAPRWVLSRFQTITGQPLRRSAFKDRDLATTRVIAEEYASYLAGLAVIYGLWKMNGGEIGTDPKSTDFGKLIVGNQRIDLMSGLQQATVFLVREITGEKTTRKGKTVPIIGEKIPFGGDDAWDVGMNFLRTKLAPIPSSTVDLRVGKDVAGRKVTLESEAKELTSPLTYQDIYKAMRDQDVPEGTAMMLLAIFGASVTTQDE